MYVCVCLLDTKTHLTTLVVVLVFFFERTTTTIAAAITATSNANQEWLGGVVGVCRAGYLAAVG